MNDPTDPTNARYHAALQEAIDIAVNAERELCARVAESEIARVSAVDAEHGISTEASDWMKAAARKIAAAIRNRSQ